MDGSDSRDSNHMSDKKMYVGQAHAHIVHGRQRVMFQGPVMICLSGLGISRSRIACVAFGI